MLTGPDDTSRPLVSVLTPSFNQGRFLETCIDSVTSQTYGRIEQIVCDGGSTDETLDVLGRAPDSVKWVSEPDTGQSNALNKALSLSSGEIIGWLNSDDAYFDVHAVEAVVDLFRRRPEVGVVYGHAALVNADGLVLHLMWAPPYSYRLLKLFNFVVQPTAFVRRTLLTDSFVDESFEYAMDRELWLRLGRRSRFARADCIVAIDRHHPARKVYRGAPRMDDENDHLDDVYANANPTFLRVFRRLFKLVGRAAGLRLIGNGLKTNASKARTDSLLGVAVRQIAVRRRFMASGVDDA